MKFEKVPKENIFSELSKGTQLYYCVITSFYGREYRPLDLEALQSDVLVFKKTALVEIFGHSVKHPLSPSDIKLLPPSQEYYVASLNRPDYCFGPVSKKSTTFNTYLERNILFKSKKDAKEYAQVLSNQLQVELFFN